MGDRLPLESATLAEFCRRHGIRTLSLFGSTLKGTAGPDSDIDLLVEFEPGRVPGLAGIAAMELELSELLGGKKVDLRTTRDLSRYFRDEVVRTAEVQYARWRSGARSAHDCGGGKCHEIRIGPAALRPGHREMLLFALVRAVEIVGEAAGRVSEKSRAAHAAIPGKAIVGMRNRWAHQDAFSSEDADRALDSMTRLLNAVSPPKSVCSARVALDGGSGRKRAPL